MALMRVYCGLAASEPIGTQAGNGWLTAAVVDDAGRLLDVCDIGDDATGYAELGALLAERSGGPNSVAVAADSDEHHVTLLLAAAGRPLAIVDDENCSPTTPIASATTTRPTNSTPGRPSGPRSASLVHSPPVLWPPPARALRAN